MPNETETEETIGFVVTIFIIGDISIGGSASPPFGYAYECHSVAYPGGGGKGFIACPPGMRNKENTTFLMSLSYCLQ